MSDTGYPLRSTVTTAITFLFAPKDRETITKFLTEECSAERLHTTSEDLVERVQLAVVKLSEGDAENFLYAARTAQIDWRDVFIWAGYGDDMKAHRTWTEDFSK